MKPLTLADLTKDELLALLADLPTQPTQCAIEVIRSRTLVARAHVAFENMQQALARLPDRKEWEEHKKFHKTYQRLMDEAHALLERR